MTISVIVNLDTRPENNEFKEMFNGTVNRDFFTHGLINKQKLFEGFDIELIVYVDKHEVVSPDNLEFLNAISDTVVLRKHTHEHLFNDNNYVRALQLASGDIICHIDQDCAVFTPNKESVQKMIDYLNTYDYVSYPSHFSPYAVNDPSFDHTWVSTRFFMCKRETLDFNEIKCCLADYDYWCENYSVKRRCHWLEHILGSISKYKGKGVFYPPMNSDEMAVFCWGNYKQGLLEILNGMTYNEVVDFIVRNNGIQYPNDLYIK